MSPSSSGSWSGARGADIIDLDRYMRGSVRPSRTAQPTEPDRTDCELVVDAGGVKARHKRFSHDSGVSDSSYSRHRRHSKPHRRSSADSQRHRERERTRPAPAEPTSTRTAGAADSSGSLRAFRAVCEQALLEQQRQIAHVAQLCERLTERAEKTERSDKPARSEVTERKETHVKARAEQKEVRSDGSEHKRRRVYEERSRSAVSQRRARLASTADLTDISSSTSRSTKDPGRKDRHRTQQCKTYKIIMSKLDELNRLFATRAPPAARPPPRRPAPSSSSVTVCDKLVATEPVGDEGRVIVPTTMLQSRLFSPRPCSLASRRITQAYSVDIAPPSTNLPSPTPRTRSPNVVTESVVKYETENEGGSTSGGDPRARSKFDLEDPVHLYAQAKKLQTLTATTGYGRVRGRSADPATRVSSRGDEHSRSPSLCAACRDYWRSLRQCLLPQLFSQPGHCKC